VSAFEPASRLERTEAGEFAAGGEGGKAGRGLISRQRDIP